MTATATFPTARTLVLPDPRPARGKHRARRSPADVADAVLSWSRRARGAFLLAGMTAGGLAAAVLS